MAKTVRLRSKDAALVLKEHNGALEVDLVTHKQLDNENLSAQNYTAAALFWLVKQPFFEEVLDKFNAYIRENE